MPARLPPRSIWYARHFKGLGARSYKLSLYFSSSSRATVLATATAPRQTGGARAISKPWAPKSVAFVASSLSTLSWRSRQAQGPRISKPDQIKPSQTKPDQRKIGLDSLRIFGFIRPIRAFSAVYEEFEAKNNSATSRVKRRTMRRRAERLRWNLHAQRTSRGRGFGTNIEQASNPVNRLFCCSSRVKSKALLSLAFFLIWVVRRGFRSALRAWRTVRGSVACRQAEAERRKIFIRRR